MEDNYPKVTHQIMWLLSLALTSPYAAFTFSNCNCWSSPIIISTATAAKKGNLRRTLKNEFKGML